MNAQYHFEDIQTLSIAEAIRFRPKMYFAKCFEDNSLDYLVVESICHAIDEHIENKCNKIEIILNLDSFSIKYNAGIDLEKTIDDITIAEAVMTIIFACSNIKKNIRIGEKYCEIGIATINYASEFCELITVFNNKIGTFKFSKGKTEFREIKIKEDNNNYTEILFKLDKSIFGDIRYSYLGVLDRIEKIKSEFKNLEINVYNEMI